MKILNVNITTLSKTTILEKVHGAISNKQKFVIFTPNPEMIEFASKNIYVGAQHAVPLQFAELLNTADINLPDGTGLKIASFLKVGFAQFLFKSERIFADLFSPKPLKSTSNDSHGLVNPPNSLRTTYYVLRTIIPGIDFMLDLCAEAEKNNWSVGLLGGMNNVAEGTKSALLHRFPKLKINYVYGDFNFSVGTDLPVCPPNLIVGAHNCVPNSAEGGGKSKHIHLNQSNPFSENPASDAALPISENQCANKQSISTPTTPLDLLFIAMGTPKEQLWISQNKNTFPATVFMEVGGSFDILSGKLHRAPKIVQAFGLEWLFRLIQEPRRLKRQLKLISFLWRVLTTKNSIQD